MFYVVRVVRFPRVPLPGVPSLAVAHLGAARIAPTQLADSAEPPYG